MPNTYHVTLRRHETRWLTVEVQAEDAGEARRKVYDEGDWDVEVGDFEKIHEEVCEEVQQIGGTAND